MARLEVQEVVALEPDEGFLPWRPTLQLPAICQRPSVKDCVISATSRAAPS
jgi:hypothetical protein